MSGIYVNDTYGPMFDVDQLCECKLGDVQIGDTVILDTDTGPLPFTVALIESYLDDRGQPMSVMGVGLDGPDSEWVMPGDSLRVVTNALQTTVTAFTHIPMASSGQQVELQRRLVATA